MIDFVYIIKPSYSYNSTEIQNNKVIETTINIYDINVIKTNIIQKLKKLNLICTFDIQKFNIPEKNLIRHLTTKYSYKKSVERLYIEGDFINLFKDIISFCNMSETKYLVLYSKGLKNNSVSTDLENSLFIRLD